MMPSGYKRLDYIESSGTQYINTLVNTNSTTNFEITFQSINVSASAMLFGAQNSWGNTSNSVWQWPNTFSVYNNDLGTVIYYDLSTNVHTLRKNGTSFKVDDNSYTISTSSFTSTNPFYLFMGYDGSLGGAHTREKNNQRLYLCKIYDDATLVRDFVPSMRESDSAIGLYDLVNNVFYENSGTGTFTYGHILENNISLSGNTLELVIGEDVSLIGNFNLRYQIILVYDSTLGSASYSWGVGTMVNLVAIPNANAQFLGWYYNSQKISSELTTSFSVTDDSTFEARFERIYNVSATTSDDHGAIQYTRGVTDQNEITFSVIPITHWHFLKYVINGTEVTTNPYIIRINSDTTCVAYFEEDEKYHINAQADLQYTSVYISANDVYGGTSVTLLARPFPNYNFVGWSDGTISNPKTIVVNEDITIVAKYVKVTETNGIYQYRCYVKDQLDLTSPPKSFMVVDTFNVKEDFLTNATSTINVLEMPSNVNNGDVIVLYNPKGQTIYQGVITSIEDTTINCSQMQSFYKGTWIYNVSPQATLEQEISVLLNNYADGKMYGSTYVDSLVAERLGGITIQYVGSTSANLPTDEDSEGNEQYTQMNMEEFIYSLYQKYGIIFDFNINMSGNNYVTIKVPTYTSIKVGNNMYAIQDMSPITEIEETNKLIIYAKDRTYRTTYIATKSGIVEEPSTTVNRFNITNTKIVFSDDAEADLVANNLPSTMYNHKVTFTLILKNFIYGFDEFKLGMPIDVWYGSDYYSSVLTGWEITKSSNQNVTKVGFVCGLVRKKLTQMLTLKKV